ncbi:hypothetical protein [Isoptericola sp. BMS4]|uniref:hypothetical protein n=1 Tax=Isoptericola sp. BMS4 TaxID=2527875 RepID=UPI00141D8F43|nr:hypothetical protein [Isoptericola sp. BMS4]
MRIRQTMTRAAAVSASALLVVGLAACGGGSDDSSTDTGDAASRTEEQTEGEGEGDSQASAGDICEATDVLTEMSSTMADVDPNDLQATLDQLEELTATVEGVEAPAEVADDWGTMATSLRGVTDSLQGAVDDPTDTEAMTKVSEAMSSLSDESFQEAGQAVSTYTAENC